MTIHASNCTFGRNYSVRCHSSATIHPMGDHAIWPSCTTPNHGYRCAVHTVTKYHPGLPYSHPGFRADGMRYRPRNSASSAIVIDNTVNGINASRVCPTANAICLQRGTRHHQHVCGVPYIDRTDVPPDNLLHGMPYRRSARQSASRNAVQTFRRNVSTDSPHGIF